MLGSATAWDASPSLGAGLGCVDSTLQAVPIMQTTQKIRCFIVFLCTGLRALYGTDARSCAGNAIFEHWIVRPTLVSRATRGARRQRWNRAPRGGLRRGFAGLEVELDARAARIEAEQLP